MIDRTETGVMLKTALRAIVDKYKLTMVCTPNQSILFKDILPEQREGVEAILTANGIKSIEQVRCFKALDCFMNVLLNVFSVSYFITLMGRNFEKIESYSRSC